MKFWPSIESFHVIRKHADHIGLESQEFYVKHKIHGTNGSVRVNKDGTYEIRNRSSVLSAQYNNFKFFQFCENGGVKDLASYLSSRMLNEEDGFGEYTTITGGLHKPVSIEIFGEYAGQGIQKKVAAAMCPPFFAVFSIVMADETGNKYIFNAPHMIDDILTNRDERDLPYNWHVIWYVRSDIVSVCPHWKATFSNTDLLREQFDKLTEIVEQIDKEDPFVKEVFGKIGPGEGVVCSPAGVYEYDTAVGLTFKVKGESHKLVHKNKPRRESIDPEVASSVEEFVRMVVTEPRLEQILHDSCHGELEWKKIGWFSNALVEDVEKETKAELEASKLDWNVVKKFVGRAANAWFRAKLKQKQEEF